MQKSPSIFLIGDAILDNYFTLENKDRDLTKELTELGFNVHNLAVDQTKVNNILDGIVPNIKYTKSRSYKYITKEDGRIYPLKELILLTDSNKSFSSVYNVGFSSFGKETKPDNMVVLSMGGNDIPSTSRIILGTDFFMNGIFTTQFIANYNKIITIAKKSCDKVVLVSLYLPYLGIGSSYGVYTPFSMSIINKWCEFIYNIGKQHNIPILDLSRTLDVTNKTHYCGELNDRLSNLANTCLAKCIQYIYDKYDGYHVYYAKNLDCNNVIRE